MLGLLDPDPAIAWRADGTAYQFGLREGLVVIRIQDEGGKIDLNRAPAPLLRGLFKVVGIDSETAEQLVDAVHDFRDADHDRRVGGAEDADYLAAGLDGGAKDAPFDQKEELMQVLGMTRQVYDAIAPYVTVHSGRSGVNVATASDVLLLAIQDAIPDEIDGAHGSRASRAPLGRYQADVVTIRAETITSGGGFFIREAVIKVSGDAFPFAILESRHVWRDATALEDTAAVRNNA